MKSEDLRARKTQDRERAFWRTRDFASRHFCWLLVVLFASAFAAQLAILWGCGYFYNSWDVGLIRDIAYHHVLGATTAGDVGYLAVAPNNTPIVLALIAIYKAVHVFTGATDTGTYIAFANVANALFLLAALIFVTLAAKKLFGKKLALAAYALGFLLISLSSYNVIFYTDTLGCFFVAFTLFLLASIREKPQTWQFALLGASLFFGAKAKITTLILPIAAGGGRDFMLCRESPQNLSAHILSPL